MQQQQQMWGLRCDTAVRSVWLDLEPMSEREARTLAAKFSPHPARCVVAVPLGARTERGVRHALAA